MIKIKTPKEIELIREASALAKEVLEQACHIAESGTSTRQIDEFVREFTKGRGAKSAPFNYKGHGKTPFPASCCISVNDVVCHGIPGDYILQEGDIVNIDVTPILRGYHGDTSATVCVGQVSKEAHDLVEFTKKVLWVGIHAVKVDGDLNDIGRAIEAAAHGAGYSVVKEFCGHGIGRKFHEKPDVCHYAIPSKGHKIVEGMVFTIEPMLNLGGPEIEIMPDHWTVMTKDRSLSAQFEHTIAITSHGVEVLTM